MTLKEYLIANSIQDSAFAAQIGVNRQSLWRYKTGERRPERKVMERIVHHTGGAVTPNDFCDILQSRQQESAEATA